MPKKIATEARKSKRTASQQRPKQRLSLHPLDFETALHAAMQTGKPPHNSKRKKQDKS